MQATVNFKKMYLISVQKWQELSAKNSELSSKNKTKSDTIILRDQEKEAESDKIIPIKNGLDSSTNIRVDQSENTRVKNINIGIKNSNEVDGQSREKKSLKGNVNNDFVIKDESLANSSSFVSCDCEKDNKQGSGEEIPNDANLTMSDTSNSQKKRKLPSNFQDTEMNPNKKTKRSARVVINNKKKKETRKKELIGSNNNKKQNLSFNIKDANVLPNDANLTMIEASNSQKKRKIPSSTQDSETNPNKKTKRGTLVVVNNKEKKETRKKELIGSNTKPKKSNIEIPKLSQNSRTIKKQTKNQKQNRYLRQVRSSFRLKRSTNLSTMIPKWVSI